MKKTKFVVAVSLGLFFLTVFSVVGAGFATMKYQSEKEVKGRVEAEEAMVKSGEVLASTDELTENEIAEHKLADDCWMIISGKVYDLTGYLVAHPGGVDVVLPYCGGDGTAAFATKGKSPGKKHSQMAQEMLDQYYLGVVGEKRTGVVQLVPTKDPGQPSIPVGMNPTSIPVVGATKTTTAVTLTAGEVAGHNTLANCWMIISGKVYNITSYVYQHPGGAGVIAPYCGKDGTNAFATKGTGSSHSNYAGNLLGNYLVGVLGASVVVPTVVPQQPTPTVVVPTAVLPTQVSGGSGGQNLNLTLGEVASHNTLQNCWMIVSDKVYNVTSYVYQHPAGAGAIAPYCGKDGTNAFATKGGKGSNHSNGAYSQLSGYLIGSLNSSVIVVPTSTLSPGVPTSVPVTGGGSNSDLPAGVLQKYPEATKKSGSYEDDGSWEGKVNTNSGCREMKVNQFGSVTKDSEC